ncbi:MAG: hypothetical protein E4H00_10795 [Myxococcales bacterium]|nr:MAG: hypothetical protein E4H00_10795 [Myxococcales bacterium]
MAALSALPTVEGQLTTAAEAFNAFLEASSEGFVRDPAPEFLVVHSFLGALIEEAMEAPAGSR